MLRSRDYFYVLDTDKNDQTAGITITHHNRLSQYPDPPQHHIRPPHVRSQSFIHILNKLTVDIAPLSSCDQDTYRLNHVPFWLHGHQSNRLHSAFILNCVLSPHLTSIPPPPTSTFIHSNCVGICLQACKEEVPLNRFEQLLAFGKFKEAQVSGVWC